METKKEKIIIIVSKWKKTKRDKIKGEIELSFISNQFKDKVGRFEINAGSDKKVIGFTKNVKDYSYEEINILNEINDNSNADILLLLHGSQPDNFNLGNAKKFDKNNVYVHVFEAGNGPIYQILIDTSGHFKECAIDFKDSYYDDWSGIKEKKFDEVWDQYLKNCKKKLYELKEDMLRALYPCTWSSWLNPKIALNKEQNGTSLRARISSLIEPGESIKAEYDFKNCLSDMTDVKRVTEYTALSDDLKKILEAENIDSEHLKSLRNYYDKLILTFSGGIY